MTDPRLEAFRCHGAYAVGTWHRRVAAPGLEHILRLIEIVNVGSLRVDAAAVSSPRSQKTERQKPRRSEADPDGASCSWPHLKQTASPAACGRKHGAPTADHLSKRRPSTLWLSLRSGECMHNLRNLRDDERWRTSVKEPKAHRLREGAGPPFHRGRLQAAVTHSHESHHARLLPTHQDHRDRRSGHRKPGTARQAHHAPGWTSSG